jgi:hypothetical protein
MRAGSLMEYLGPPKTYGWSSRPSMPRKHNPTPEERDERIKLPLDPEMAIEAIMGTGLHRDEDDQAQEDSDTS